jgi:peptidyl-prolyl cis-trans isomerase C
VNRVKLLSFTLGGALLWSGLAEAQTTQASPSKKTPSPAPAATSTPAPVPSGITAPPDPNKVVLTIGDEKITAGQFDKLVQTFPPQLQAAATGPQRRQFIEQYAQLKLAAKEAERRNIDKKPEVQSQLAIQRDSLLAQSLYQDLMNSVKVTDADIQKYYDTHKNEFETVKAHHILIRFKGSPVPLGKDKKELTDEEALSKAKEVEKRLAAGEDFTKVAKEDSDDSGTPGGDLGTFSKGQMVPAFDQAAFTLPVGKVSDPVKTQFGYHIIRVDARDTKTLDQARTEIEQKVKPELARTEIEGLRAKNNVVIDEEFFKAPTPPASATPPAKQ